MFYFTGTRKPDFKNIHKINYDEYWKSRGFSLNKKLKEREVIILKQIPSGSKVIDIGCGNSLLPVALKNKNVNIEVADISSVVLDGYRKHDINNVQIDLEKIESTELKDMYDYIIMSEVLEHITNPEDVIDNLKSHTKNFVLTIPNSAFYRFRLHLFFSGRFFTQWFHHPSEHVRYWSHIDFLDWLVSRGLKVTYTEASNGLSFLGIPFYRIWPNLFGHQICYITKVI